MKIKCTIFYLSPDGAAAALIRVSLGVLFFFAGLGKFLAPIGVAGVSEALSKGFEQTYLPMALVKLFLLPLPYLEVITGILLILGLCTIESLIFAGLLLISLALGKLVQMDYPTVSHNFIYVFMAAIGLWFAARDNPYSLDNCLGRCRTTNDTKVKNAQEE